MDKNAPTPAVTLYGHSACGQCKISAHALTQAGIPFQYRDVRVDPDAKARIEDWGYTAVPVTEVNGTHWYGFQPDRIKAMASSDNHMNQDADPELVMQLAIQRGYSEDLCNREKEDLLDEANWILNEGSKGHHSPTLPVASSAVAPRVKGAA